ncbi:protein kinase, partial [Planctomycetota bacterium]
MNSDKPERDSEPEAEPTEVDSSKPSVTEGSKPKVDSEPSEESEAEARAAEEPDTGTEPVEEPEARDSDAEAPGPEDSEAVPPEAEDAEVPTEPSQKGTPVAEPKEPEAAVASALEASDSKEKASPQRVLPKLPVLKRSTVLANRYTVRNKLGKGPTGDVYQAYDVETEARVALKVVSPALVADERAVHSFRMAMGLTRQFSHAATVSPLDVDEDPDHDLHFFTMELLKGQTLRSWLDAKTQAGEKVDPETAFRVTNQLLSALRYAHETMAHGNLNPKNVLVEGLRLKPKVLNFGMTALRSIHNMPLTASEQDTLAYVPTEQRGKLASRDGWTDLYGVAVMLYEMLHGKRPPSAGEPSAAKPEQKPLSEPQAESGQLLTGADDLLTLERDTVVSRRYAVKKRLGKNKQSSVYRVHDSVLQRNVALKVVAPPTVGGEEETKVFSSVLGEVQKFVHPGTVKIHHVGQDLERGVYFLAMENIKGQTLKSWLDKKKQAGEPVDQDDAFRIASHLLAVLRGSHQTMCHGDLNPENILVVDSERLAVKVLNFGMSKIRAAWSDTKRAHDARTVRYLPPEQREDPRNRNTWTDIYAVAVILYEMLYGELPLVATTKARRRREGLRAAPPLVPELVTAPPKTKTGG